MKLKTLVILTSIFLILSCKKNSINEVPSTSKEEAKGEALFSLQITEDGITDSYGNTVEDKIYSRIIYISPGAVETAYMIGAEPSILAMSHTRSPIWPEDKTSKIESVGSVVKPGMEKIILLQPDLVFLNSMIESYVDPLQSNGLNVLVFDGKSIDDILNNVVILGHITGKTDEAAKLVEEKTEQLRIVKESIKNNNLDLKGAFLYSTTPLMAFTGETLPGEILSLLGVKNIADNIPGNNPILSPEFLLNENPDFLLGAMRITSVDDILKANNVIAKTRAGIEKNISIIPSDQILRPTPRVIDSLEILSEWFKKVGNK